MNNILQKSIFICNNYLTEVFCMKSLSTQPIQSLNHFALCSLIKTRKIGIRTVTHLPKL